MMTRAQTPAQAQDTMARLLDEAATLASAKSSESAEHGQWALSVRWGEICTRITQLASDLLETGYEIPPLEDPSSDQGTNDQDKSILDLLTEAERCTRPFAPGKIAGAGPHMVVELLDLAREVRSLGS